MKYSLIALWLCLLWLPTACYEPQEGCLDAAATNFDLDADESCDGCCVYPTLKVSFTHRWLTPDEAQPLRLSPSWYTDGLGQPFRIKSIRYYWSDLALITADGLERRPTDSIEMRIVNTPGDTSLYLLPDNFVLADAASSTRRELGTFPYVTSFTQLNAYFGVIDPANQAVPTSLPQRHPLAPQLGGQYLDSQQGYLFAKIELYRDTVPSDTIPITVNISGPANRFALSLNLPGTLSNARGFNSLLNIQTNYASWFSGVNVRGDLTQLQQAIFNNIPGSFSVLSFGRE